MAKWDEELDDLIIKALLAKRKLGRNEIYNEHVNKRYKEVRHKTVDLSKDTFDNHLKFLLQNDVVGKNDAGQRGTKIEHFLTQEAKQKLQIGG